METAGWKMGLQLAWELEAAGAHWFERENALRSCRVQDSPPQCQPTQVPSLSGSEEEETTGGEFKSAILTVQRAASSCCITRRQ